MNNIIEKVWKQQGLTPIEFLPGNTFTAEAGAHTFVISGVDQNGAEVALSGSPSASFIRADGTTVAISSGATLTNGKVHVTLSEECYGVTGRFALTVFLTSNGQKVAIYACVGNVARSNTSAVSPGVTADVVDLVNRIDTATASVPATYTALLAAIATDYSDSATYSAGDYVWYSGTLYRAKQDIDTAESWTAGHWDQVVLANSLNDDITDLKSALTILDDKYQTGGYDYSSYVQGRRDASGNLIADTTRVTTAAVLKLHKGDTIEVSGIASGQKYAIAGSGYDSGWKTAGFLYTATADANLFVNFATSSGSSAILPSEITAEITVTDNSSTRVENTIEISAINNTLPHDIAASAEGYQLYNVDIFTLGQYESGVPGTYYQNRIRFISPQTAPKQIVLESLNDNIEFSVALYDNVETFLYQTAYIKKYVVESGKKYAITIRDITKTDYTVKADIYDLRSKVGFYSVVTEEINNTKQGNFVIDLACVEMENGSVNPDGTETTDEYNSLRKLRTVDYFSVPSGAIIRNSNTALQFGVVFFNPLHKGLGSSGWISDESYTINNACLIRIVIRLRSDDVLPEYMKLTYRSDFAIEYSSDSLVNNVLSAFNELKPNAGTYSYTGQPINLWKKSYSIEKLWAFQHATTEGSYSKQASGYYGGVVFKCYANDLIQLYNFETGELLNEFPIVSEHGQTIEFSNEFYSSDDEFPLAYISSEYRQDCAVYVNRITRTGATLIRTLTFPRQTVGLGSQCILDSMNNALYKIGWKSDTDYQTPADGNCMIVTKWDLNNLHDNGDGTFTPEFIKTYETAFIDTLQGNVVFDGRAYIVSSNPYTPKTKVYVLDLGAEEYTNILTEFIEPIRDHEAEGIFFVPDGEKYAMIIDVQSTGLYKLTF